MTKKEQKNNGQIVYHTAILFLLELIIFMLSFWFKHFVSIIFC